MTYITKKIIATSFPSEGLRACYRNNISDVARYLDEKHGYKKYDGVHRYWVYNLCSEITYDEEKFHNQVRRVCIPDHNVPTVKQMIHFVSEVKRYDILHSLFVLLCILLLIQYQIKLNYRQIFYSFRQTPGYVKMRKMWSLYIVKEERYVFFTGILTLRSFYEFFRSKSNTI